jgi:hypothetical protein
MRLRCVHCGHDDVAVIVNMRRYIKPDHASIDRDGYIEYHGWGENVEDEIVDLWCENCNEHSTVEQAQQEARRSDDSTRVRRP